MSGTVPQPGPHPATSDADQPLFGAIAAGVVAAFLGGGLWAAIVVVTHYEVGWVAWGVGALVGIAMARMTSARGRHVAMLGALLAGLGLVTGKLLIVTFAARPGIAREIVNDPALLTQAALFELRETRALPESVQTRLDALASTDTLPDDLWAAMEAAGAEHAASASTADRERMARGFASMVTASVGTSGLLRAQLSPWDLLWLFLALTTAWRLLSGAEPSPAPARER